MTESATDGRMPDGARVHIGSALDKIESVLRAAGATLDEVVEVTSYHVVRREDFDVCEAAFRARFAKPRPAWAAVEVTGLRRPGARVEIRAVAHVSRA